MERSIKYNFFDDLESIQHKLSSDYSLSIYLSRRFPILMVHHFLRTNPYKMSIFQRSVTCSFFFRNCTHTLTRTQGKKFEDMFLVKVASKGTSLNVQFFSAVYEGKGMKFCTQVPRTCVCKRLGLDFHLFA